MTIRPIIGLEIHVQLATRTKMFCPCALEFAAEPNSRVCPVCLGMPGSLPVMNRTAYELSVRAATALNCTVDERHQVGPQELLLPRHAEELPDQPVRPAALVGGMV
ncbi:MAG: hypothetical protein B6D36_06445 [Planctomycetes bacterium UTPLA1]|nr:MAG: hypothetical protein B6D36_06445 [Planctomycetes bacterium UTPLA1]